MQVNVTGAKCIGIDAVPVTVEVDIDRGLGIHLVGLADVAVKESLLRTVTALQSIGFRIPGKKIVINLAPADMHKKGGGYDVPIALGIIAASRQIELPELDRYLIMGELGLDATVRPVQGALPMAELAEKMGLRGCILPEISAREAAGCYPVRLYGVNTLTDVLLILAADGSKAVNMDLAGNGKAAGSIDGNTGRNTGSAGNEAGKTPPTGTVGSMNGNAGRNTGSAGNEDDKMSKEGLAGAADGNTGRNTGPAGNEDGKMSKEGLAGAADGNAGRNRGSAGNEAGKTPPEGTAGSTDGSAGRRGGKGNLLRDAVPSYVLFDRETDFRMPQENKEDFPDFSEIIGQENAKRGLEIAAAGAHNIIMIGTPGSGKSSLAKALAGILPPLSKEEAIITSKIYSVAGKRTGGEGLVWHRPFRSPHYSASLAALIGGGNGGNIFPGEVSLAQYGILFLDEFTQLPQHIAESLRAPLEDRKVTISRLRTRVEYPASFMLVAAANPCPCGYYGDGDRCTCTPAQRAGYLSRLSGPIMDRIDLQIRMHPVDAKLLVNHIARKDRSAAPGVEKAGAIGPETSREIARRVVRARTIQQIRFRGESIFTNSEMNNRQLNRYCPLSAECRNLMEKIIGRMGLSARAFTRVIKLARTIADLEAAADDSLWPVEPQLPDNPSFHKPTGAQLPENPPFHKPVGPELPDSPAFHRSIGPQPPDNPSFHRPQVSEGPRGGRCCDSRDGTLPFPDFRIPDIGPRHLLEAAGYRFLDKADR